MATSIVVVATSYLEMAFVYWHMELVRSVPCALVTSGLYRWSRNPIYVAGGSLHGRLFPPESYVVRFDLPDADSGLAPFSGQKRRSLPEDSPRSAIRRLCRCHSTLSLSWIALHASNHPPGNARMADSVRYTSGDCWEARPSPLRRHLLRVLLALGSSQPPTQPRSPMSSPRWSPSTRFCPRTTDSNGLIASTSWSPSRCVRTRPEARGRIPRGWITRRGVRGTVLRRPPCFDRWREDAVFMDRDVSGPIHSVHRSNSVRPCWNECPHQPRSFPGAAENKR